MKNKKYTIAPPKDGGSLWRIRFDAISLPLNDYIDCYITQVEVKDNICEIQYCEYSEDIEHGVDKGKIMRAAVKSNIKIQLYDSDRKLADVDIYEPIGEPTFHTIENTRVFSVKVNIKP